jgi:NAD(P)-dependent dehydrogenase (short-subunit alcohol dehydrogenase family)
MRPIAVPVLILLAAALAARGADVIVYSRVADAGRKLAAPTADHPVYYLLVSGGFNEAGQTVRGERSPPPAVVEKLVRGALGAQGYVAASRQSPHIDIFIVFNWGYLNPIVVSTFAEGRANPRNPGEQPPLIEHREILNDQQMLGLLGVAALDNRHFATEDQVRQIAQAAGDNRYFVVLSARPTTSRRSRTRSESWCGAP